MGSRSKRPGHKSHERTTVRVGHLRQVLTGVNAEMGEKTARVIAEYHRTLVEPRLVWLETPWYKKLWLRSKDIAVWLWQVIRRTPEPEIAHDLEYHVGDPVETTGKGSAFFEGERVYGKVVAIERETPVAPIRVQVQLDESEEEPQWFSPGAWCPRSTQLVEE